PTGYQSVPTTRPAVARRAGGFGAVGSTRFSTRFLRAFTRGGGWFGVWCVGLGHRWRGTRGDRCCRGGAAGAADLVAQRGEDAGQAGGGELPVVSADVGEGVGENAGLAGQGRHLSLDVD